MAMYWAFIRQRPHNRSKISVLNFIKKDFKEQSNRAVEYDDCPIGGPFDLWRKNYFLEYGKPPDDTIKMFPLLNKKTIANIATAAVIDNKNLDEVLYEHEDCDYKEQLIMAYAYFVEWRKHAPFLSKAFQDLPLRPARTSPETFEESMEDMKNAHCGKCERQSFMDRLYDKK